MHSLHDSSRPMVWNTIYKPTSMPSSDSKSDHIHAVANLTALPGHVRGISNSPIWNWTGFQSPSKPALPTRLSPPRQGNDILPGALAKNLSFWLHSRFHVYTSNSSTHLLSSTFKVYPGSHHFSSPPLYSRLSSHFLSPEINVRTSWSVSSFYM